MILNPGETEPYINRAGNKVFARGWIDFTKAVFAPYINAGRLVALEGDITVAPGIRALATHGHTPGHTSYIVETKGQTVIVMGDLVLMAALQFPNPDLGSSFDSDPNAAAEQRRHILGLAAANDFWIAGSHVAFPSIGHIRVAGDGFTFLPAGGTSILAPAK
jgi:glyoxylase-like metal-dependent hydrolase (beta-lactamase superfamily II)